MKKLRTIIIFVFLFYFNLHLNAQEKQINSRFKGGEEALTRFLNENLKYPEKSREYKTVGYSITGITITPEGKIKKISIINPLDEYIDDELKKLLEKTKNKWLRSDFVGTDQTFYVQVVYQIVSSLVDGTKVDFPVKDIYNFIDPVLVTATTWNDEYLPVADELLGTKLTESLKNSLYENALRYADELIRRNPFNKEIYQLRIFINQKLKNNDLITKDALRLQSFIPGVSMDQFIITHSQLIARNDSITKKAESIKEKIYEKVDQMPEFPEGQDKMMEFISQNLQYPNRASREKVQGMVVVKFVVNKEGRVINPTIIKSVHPSLDAEALRVIRLMPLWKPGIQDGKAVNVYFTMPLRFVLNY